MYGSTAHGCVNKWVYAACYDRLCFAEGAPVLLTGWYMRIVEVMLLGSVCNATFVLSCNKIWLLYTPDHAFYPSML